MIIIFLVTFSVNNNTVIIETLTSSNYKSWKKDMELAIELADIDLAMVTPRPDDLTDESTNIKKELYKIWYKLNRMCYLTIKRSILKHLLSGLPATTIAKDFLDAVSQMFKVSINAEIGSLLKKLYYMKYTGTRGVREYTLTMVHI